MGENLPDGIGGPLLIRIGEQVLAERERWPLFIPVFLGLGIALYFSLRVEPPIWVGLGAALVAPLPVLVRRHSALVWITAWVVGCLALGLAAGVARTAWVAAPVLERDLGPLALEATVAAVEELDGSQRVLLEDLAYEARGAAVVQRARLRLPAKAPALAPGHRIAAMVMLKPPGGPSVPGGFDFGRSLYFQGIGAVGFTLGAPRILAEPDPSGWQRGLAALRHGLTRRIVAGAGGGEEGGIAAALMTGERAAVPEELLQAYRDSGLAHLLSISGLHMSLVAGLVFLAVRGGLALVPAVALRYPIKKWTAVAAMAATFGYLLIAGAPVPTQRAFLMTSVVLLAVLADRTAISLRLVAWAAVAVLLTSPEALTGPSFQMSFAAVAALVAAYEAAAGRMVAHREDGLARKAVLYLAGVALSTLVAGSVTAVYAVHHFGRFASWSLAANLVAVPLTGFWVMPLALLAFLLMPMGLEAVALQPMAWGLALVNQVARGVAAWPGAAIAMPVLPLWGMAVFTLGGLWLCLWQRPWRWAGLAGMALGLASMAIARPPDVLVNEDGRLMAVRAEDGRLLLSLGKGDRLDRESWGELYAYAGAEGRFPALGAEGPLSCDWSGCLYSARGTTVALVRAPDALAEDCAAAQVVVSAVPVRGPCAPVTVDRFDLWRNGAHALWLDGASVRVESVAEGRGDRPWSRRRGKGEEE